jgi:hypothetical protein
MRETAAFAAAWEEGRALTLEEAIAEALGETGESGSSRAPGHRAR